MRVLVWFRTLSSPTFLAFVIALYLVVSLSLFLAWPPPMIDEALFGSTAKTLLDQGHMGTPLVRGLESRVYWQPPVYFITLVPVISAGGYNAAALRAFSIFVGAGILAVVFLLGTQFANVEAARVATLLLACDPLFVNNVKFARMDGLCMLFMMLGLVVFLKSGSGTKPLLTLLAGLLVALAALTHPFGIVAAIVVTVYILVQPDVMARVRIKHLAVFLFPLFVGMVLWGVYVSQDVPGFLLQMRYQWGRKDRPLVVAVANAVRQYRHVPLSLVFPLAGLIFLIPHAFRQWGKETLLALFLLLIMAVTISKFENPYHVYIAPVGAIAVGMLLVDLWNRGSGMRRRVALLSVGAFLLNSALVFGYLNYLFHVRVAADTDYNQFCEAVSARIPAGARMCGWGSPCLYWGLHEHRPDVMFTDKAFLDSLRANEVIRNIDYVVLSRAFSPDEDEAGLMGQREAFAKLCVRNHLEMTPVAVLGKRERYAYSAEVYHVIPVAGQ